MSEAIKIHTRSAGDNAVVPRLFVLELTAGRIHSMNTDGSDRKTIVTDCHMPDGVVVVDVDAGHIYWTDMGIPNNAGLGRIFRANGVRTKARIIQRTYHCASATLRSRAARAAQP